MCLRDSIDAAREYGKRMLRITMVVRLIGCVIILALRPLILDFYRDKLTETAIYYLGIFIIMTTWRLVGEGINLSLIHILSAMIAIGIINIVTVPLISKLGSSSAKNGYLFVAIIYGCIFAACHFFCFAKTKEQVAIPEKEKISIKVQLKAVMQNKPYLLALVCLLYTSRCV